jgi:hypothetical protein
MEIQEILLILTFAVITSLASRMVVGGLYEPFTSSPSIPIQDILKHIKITSTIVSNNSNQYWTANDNPQETIHISSLPLGLTFNKLTINNTEAYRPFIRLCNTSNCQLNGESWAIYSSSGKSTEPSIDFINHSNGYIASDSGESQKRIQKEFNQPGMSIGILSKNLKIQSTDIESLPPPPPAPPCPVTGEGRIWTGACMSKDRMEAEFRYWSTPSRVADLKRKNQFNTLKESMLKLNQDYKKLTGSLYNLSNDFK